MDTKEQTFLLIFKRTSKKCLMKMFVTGISALRVIYFFYCCFPEMTCSMFG